MAYLLSLEGGHSDNQNSETRNAASLGRIKWGDKQGQKPLKAYRRREREDLSFWATDRTNEELGFDGEIYPGTDCTQVRKELVPSEAQQALAEAVST